MTDKLIEYYKNAIANKELTGDQIYTIATLLKSKLEIEKSMGDLLQEIKEGKHE